VSAAGPKRAADAIFALGSATLSAVVYFGARDLPESPFDPLGPAAFPLALAALLAVLAAVQLARLAFGFATGASAVVLVHGLDGGGTHRLRVDLAVAIYAMTIAYSAALAFGAGFFAATTVYVIAAGASLAGRDRRAVIRSAAVGAVLATGIWALFTHVFLLQWP
jgi:hypothetical protein